MASKLVSLREAAAKLTAAGDKVEKSTLSRYIAAHSAALNPTRSGKVLLVDVERLAAHRRSYLGKGSSLVKGPPSARKPDMTAPLSRADEQQGKLRADRLLAVDRLAKRKADLVPMFVAERSAISALIAMKSALDDAAAETAALIAAERGGGGDLIRSVLMDHGRQADAAMETALQKAGFLVTPVAKLREMAALVPADDPEPPEPQDLDEERAAKARMDRLRQELTLLEKRRVVIPRQEAEFALVDALQLARQALATAARDGIEVLAKAAGVEPVFVRPYPRQHERRILALFAAKLSTRTGGQR